MPSFVTEDLRLGWRSLRRAKAFSAAAILTMSLGIAGTTVMFTLIRGVLLRSLPVRDESRLIVAWKELRASGFSHHPFGDAEIDAVGKASQLLAAVAGVDSNGVGREAISEGGTTSDVKTALVTGGFFAVLGVRAALGRELMREDDVEGAERVLVISHGLWQRRYGGSGDCVGRRVLLGGQPFTIVGVMPPDLDYPIGVEAWRTTHSVWLGGPFGAAARREVDLVARLEPGVTIAQATSELIELTRVAERAAPSGAVRGLVPVVRSFAEAIVGDVRGTLVALMAAVGIVLLIASANVANLLLMRGEARRAELAVRVALGAGRARLVQQVLAESLVLTLVAAAAGLFGSWWSLHGLITLLPEGLPRVESVRIDWTVVIFTVAIALVTSALAGLAPALALGRADLVAQLRGGGRAVTGAATRHGQRVLVVAQVALAVTIVSAAALLSRSVLRLQAVDMGLAWDRLVFVELILPQGKYIDRVSHAHFFDETVARLESLPGIAAATSVNVPPFAGEGGWDVPSFTAEGQSVERAAANPSLNLESVDRNYFATFEVRLVHGRAFTAADRAGALEVAIVSEDVAARVWPGENPVGKRVKFGNPDSRESWRTVVGVAAPTRYRELARQRPTLYLPAAQFLETAEMLVLRTSAPLALVAAMARDQVRGVDRDVQVARVAPFARMLAGPLARPRFNAFLLSLFAVTALLLATIGLYAVMAAFVRRRDREIALRVALGATAGNVRRLVMGEAVGLAGLGASIGLAGAAATTRLVGAMLFEIGPLDPATLLGAAALLVASSALAAFLPARRATLVDPMIALRSE